MTENFQGSVLPAEFTLTVKKHDNLGWIVTSDAHRGFFQIVSPEQGLADGLREVPMALRAILVAQADANTEKEVNITNV